MKVNNRLVTLILFAVVSTTCLADVDGCVEMTKHASDIALPPVKEAFVASGRSSLDRVDISRGRDCGVSVYFVFEAKQAYRNFGSHWIVSRNKKSGKIDIQDGI